jgi:hypothetical protein
MKRAKFLSLAILYFLCLSSIASFPIAKSQTEPIVSITQWHTSSPVIQPPATQEAHVPPILRIVSPENQTVFQTNNVTLTIDVASYFWVIDSVYYQSDWQDGIHQLFGVLTDPDIYPSNASIVATFPQIPYGNHTVTVYVNTHDNSHSNATVTFSTERVIEKQQPKPPSLLPAIAIVSIVSVVFGITVGLVLYRRHRKTSNLWQAKNSKN